MGKPPILTGHHSTKGADTDETTLHDADPPRGRGRSKLSPPLQIPKNRSTGNLAVVSEMPEAQKSTSRIRFSFDAGSGANTDYDSITRCVAHPFYFPDKPFGCRMVFEHYPTWFTYHIFLGVTCSTLFRLELTHVSHLPPYTPQHAWRVACLCLMCDGDANNIQPDLPS